MSNKRGHLFVISAPSGTGKSTVIGCVRRRLPKLAFSVSCTTRQRRGSERDGVDYHFISRERFQEMIAEGAFAEWAEVHGHLYGTPREPLQRALESGGEMLLDIDVQGRLAIKGHFPEALTVFLLPPDLTTLRARLTGRGTDSPEQIELRLRNAAREMLFKDRYDRCIINDEVDRACAELARLIEQSRG